MHLASQRLEHSDQDVVVAGGHNRFVEQLVSFTETVHVPLFAILLAPLGQLPNPGELFPRRPFCRQPDGKLFKARAYNVEVFDIVHTDRPDKDALVGRTLGQAVVHQALESVPERCAANAELLAQGALVKPLAGWEYARFYIVSEPEICPLRKRPAVERPLLAHSVGHFLSKRG